MLSVNINNDVEKYEESVIGTFNLKQSVYIIIAFIVGVGSICLMYFVFDFSLIASCYLSIIPIIPVVALGFGQKDGMTFTQRIMKILTLRKKPLLYSTSFVDYEELERLEEEKNKKRKKGVFNVKKEK